MEQKTILAFNLSPQRLSKLRFACMKIGMRVESVPVEDFCQPFSTLCGLTPRVENGTPVTPFPGEMLYFAFQDLAAVNRCLSTMKQLRMPPFRLKGVMTETNLTWTPLQLHLELLREHQALQQGNSAHTDPSNAPDIPEKEA